MILVVGRTTPDLGRRPHARAVPETYGRQGIPVNTGSHLADRPDGLSRGPQPRGPQPPAPEPFDVGNPRPIFTYPPMRLRATGSAKKIITLPVTLAIRLPTENRSD